MDRTALRGALGALASNHLWTWHYRTSDLLSALPTADPDRHPVLAVGALDDDQLDRLLDDGDFVAAVADQLAVLGQTTETAVTSPDIVYFSPEFGISEVVPQYSGGLGILAGDHLKSASDLGTSLAGVGLFYRHGFFRQLLEDGQQAERIETYDPPDFGCVDTGIVVEVPISDRLVAARVWRLQVGRIPLLLLDTDLPVNSADDRAITDRLYSGDQLHRLEQELVLGVGGARAVTAIGWKPGVYHSNEGHAGFLTLTLLDQARSPGGATTLAQAVERVKPHVLFTTHTPVPAGIDRFPRTLIDAHLRPWAQAWGDTIDDIAALGTDPHDGADVFNMAALCLHIADRANGVSQMHGEVSRGLFAMVPGGDAITSVTNGVHARTWTSPGLQDLFDAELGDGWDRGADEAWSNIDGVSAEAIVACRAATRDPLTELLADRAGVTLQRDALVIGFARRFATYKRANLLLRHPDVLAALLADDDRPVHFVFAGKAHPADVPGKSLLADIVAFGDTPAANQRFSFLPDYDIAVARAMYFGCDVWLNNPVRPREASGTSGEKAALNGVLNCSILDGWWAEMSDGRNGWDIPTSDSVVDAVRDDDESAATLTLLGEIAAEFHADGGGHPSAVWIERMRHNWRTLGPKVTAARMVADYERTLYQPMLAAQRR
ncbi:MAG TPA: alpha-glucan family phosphorylase [Ilumatobacter sp.]|nr:alpha-glucan family phosphorylase [Ilumatobacter sp.]